MGDQSIDVGPNRMKFFYDNVDAAMSAPPITEPLLLSMGTSDIVEHNLHAPIPSSLLSKDEMVAAYVADAEYTASVGLEGPVEYNAAA